MYRKYPPSWEFNANKNTIYIDRLVTRGDDVRRMVCLADSILEGQDVVFYWAIRSDDDCIKRNVEIGGVEIQISINQRAHCQISVLGKPDVIGVSTGPVIWSGSLKEKATSYSHLLATARQALIEHLEKED